MTPSSTSPAALTNAAGLTPYIALFTVMPAADGTGGTEVSTSSTGYGRVSSAGKWAAPSNGQIANNATIDFGSSSASWGTVVGWGIYTASTGGTLLRYGAITPNVAIPSGTPVSFPAGSLQLSEIS